MSEEGDMPCPLLNSKHDKLLCVQCVVEGCSYAVEAKQEDIGVCS